MYLEIVIPWNNPDCEYRKKNFIFLAKYYSIFGNIVIGESKSIKFNRAEARNNGIKKCKSNLILVVDADCYISSTSIAKSLSITDKFKAIRPFTSIHYLNEKTTNSFFKDKIDLNINSYDNDYFLPSEISIKLSGGAYIIDKELWLSVGGMNESFLEWGLEDTEFNIKIEKEIGRFGSIYGPLFHLYHPQKRVHDVKNIELLSKTKEYLK